MFIDKVKIKVKAGDGGNGAISFLREKYRPNGGPAGGNGGKGGSIYMQADEGMTTLQAFIYKKKFFARNGEPGANKNQYGKDAEDILIKVPLGTIVTDISSSQVIADFSTPKTVLIAKGGRGGRGNAKFATSRNRVPRIAENGLPGAELDLELELRLLADVGLVGLPSVGKSSLLSAITNARPLIGDYPFTTLTPELGVVNNGNYNFVLADLPGLIEGASLGKGLGHQFLRHIKRCKVLVHLLDITSQDPLADYQLICNEISTFDPSLIEREMVIVFNKIDESEQQIDLSKFESLTKHKIFFISALKREGLDSLINYLGDLLSRLISTQEVTELDEYKVYNLDEVEEDYVIFHPSADLWVVKDGKLGRLYQKINLTTDQGMAYLQKMLRQFKIEKRLKEKGIKDGDRVIIVNFEFIYHESDE